MVRRSLRARPGAAAAPRGAGRAPGGERGIALVSALIVMSVILFLGTFALVSSRSEIRTSANYRSRVQAQYFAESGLDEVVGLQNDLAASPRYLFDEDSYVSTGADSSVLIDIDAVNPETGKVIGTIHRVILDKNPLVEQPPYRLRSTADLDDGSQAVYEVDIDAISLLDFATYSESSIWYCAPGLTMGRVYVDGDVTLLTGCSGTEVFMKRVEYTGSLNGESLGDFREGHMRILPYPQLTALIDLDFYDDAARSAGVCGQGRGLYITTQAGKPSSVRSQSQDLFQLVDTGQPGVNDLDDDDDWDDTDGRAVTGCRTAGGCFQIDLTLFDFSANPITYGGETLRAYDGTPLRPSNFNGVIYVEGELHVWGILGGRSTEDRTVRDRVTLYDALIRRPTSWGGSQINPTTEPVGISALGRPFHHHPDFDELDDPWDDLTANLYSNNRLDPGEDTNGNGILDPAGKGRNLMIVTEDGEDIVIDHNIHYGTDPDGNRVSLGLISGDAIYFDLNSPRALILNASKMARGDDRIGSWDLSIVGTPMNDQDTHRRNFWAKRAGETTPSDSSYVFDLNGNGAIETNTGMGLAGDRNETAMRDAWTILDKGNNVSAGGLTHGAWATGLHGSTMVYDFELASSEPPCSPVLPYYGVTPGTFTEVRN